MEEAVEAVHQQVDGQLVAVGERGDGRVVQEIGEGPLFDGAVTGVIDEKRAAVERGENLLRDDGGILAIGKNFGGLERRWKIRGRKFRGGGEVRAYILIGDEQSLPIA